ncbi:hypothetical protein V6Z11_A04G102600 [Gossypium hirsutum]|uniref:CASP-like protein 5A1 n=1 Tax=Gossypium hirsutum TaxID=3635 RepID=A0A1U8NKG5_GOSHI|nr:CASP-like protein 5A1 [Gossypium hirsutum]
MNVSRPAVHPVEAPPMTEAAVHGPRVRMKDIQGMPGTKGGLFLRLSQFIFSIISVSVMATTNDFRSATAFCFGADHFDTYICRCICISWHNSLD